MVDGAQMSGALGRVEVQALDAYLDENLRARTFGVCSSFMIARSAQVLYLFLIVPQPRYITEIDDLQPAR